MPRLGIVHLLFAVPLIHCAGAQETAGVRTTLLTYAPFGLPQGFTAFFQTGDSVRAFNASAATLGVPAPHTGPQRLMLRGSREEFDLAAEQLAAKPPLAVVDLPADSDLILILAVPHRQSGAMQFRAYDLSSNALRSGGYRIFNFSTQSIALRLGGQDLALEPGRDRTLEGGRWGDQVSALPLQIATRTNGESSLAYSGFWEHYPQRRQLFFLFDGQHPSEPVIFSSFDAGTPPRQERE